MQTVDSLQMLFLSPRNSLEGQLHVLQHSDCKVFASPAAKPAGVEAILAARKMHFIEIPELDVLLEGPAVPAKLFNKTFEQVRHEPLLVLHSSGSTSSLPKPVPYNHGCVAAQCTILEYESQEDDENNRIMWQQVLTADRLLIGFPMFHAAGLFFLVTYALISGVQMVIPPGGQPLNADLVDKMLKYADVCAACLPPAILEDLPETPSYLENMQHLKYIITGGAPLPQSVGETIQRSGPRICNVMASTETGILPFVETTRKDWQYVRIQEDLGTVLRPRTDDLYELVLVRPEESKPLQGVFENFPNLQEYATRDLFRRHSNPTKHDLWLPSGRVDDVVVLLNGEKFNPVAMEKEIQRHPHVLTALIYGHERVQAALLVEPSWRYQSASIETRAAFLRDLWPTIEKANLNGPAHGRVYQSLVLLTTAAKPLKRTDKGNVIRNAAFKLYAEELDALYEALEAPAGPENAHSATLLENAKYPNGISTNGDLMDYVATNGIMKDYRINTSSIRQYLQLSAFPHIDNLTDDDNLFDAGMDSLHVLELCRSINSAIGRNFIRPTILYANPSITKLASALETRKDFMPEIPDNRSGKVTSLLAEFSNRLPRARHIPNIAILTGSSGSLGAHLLRALVKSRRFAHIYCLVRALPKSINYSPSNVTFLLSEFSQPQLGLSEDIYLDLLNTTTHILHNAWLVDFNLPLDFFTPHLNGVANFINFSASAVHDPRIFFISSIGAVLNGYSPIREQIYHDLEVTQPIGYAESKHISERLLHRAGLKAGVRSTICRVGQIAGPVHEDGIWNKRDWLPSLVVTSKNMKCIPDSLGSLGAIEWIPADIVAQIILELFDPPVTDLDRRSHMTQVFHVVNPSRIEWEALLPTILAHLEGDIETVSLSTWVERLNKCAEEGLKLEKFPALKLLEFFESTLARPKEKVQQTVLETAQARLISPSLTHLGPVSTQWMELWLKQWGV